MESIQDLLLAKNLDQPSDMKSIQAFLNKELKYPFSIKNYPKHITISVANSKVAYLVRTMLPGLEAYAAPTKKIHVRIDNRLEM